MHRWRGTIFNKILDISSFHDKTQQIKNQFIIVDELWCDENILNFVEYERKTSILYYLLTQQVDMLKVYLTSSTWSCKRYYPTLSLYHCAFYSSLDYSWWWKYIKSVENLSFIWYFNIISYRQTYFFILFDGEIVYKITGMY